MRLTVAQSVADWHERAMTVETDADIPILGLFKERAEGAGHSYGTTAVRGCGPHGKPIAFDKPVANNALDGETDPLRLMTLRQMDDAWHR